MALLFLGEDPWLLEHESCEKLHRDIKEQLLQRQQYHRTSDKYAQLSANIRLRLKQFNNEVGQLSKKLDVAARSDSITSAEVERRTRQIEDLHTKGVQMQKLFSDQGKNKILEDRATLLGARDDEANSSNSYVPTDQIRANQRRMIGDQERGLEDLSKIISRQRDIANVISNEVDFHNEILDDLGTQVDRTDARVRTETQHISVVDNKDKTCIYWVVIILLFISIVVVAVI